MKWALNAQGTSCSVLFSLRTLIAFESLSGGHTFKCQYVTAALPQSCENIVSKHVYPEIR